MKPTARTIALLVVSCSTSPAPHAAPAAPAFPAPASGCTAEGGSLPPDDAGADGAVAACCNVPGSLVSYLHTTTTDTTDTRCGPVAAGSCTIDLEGYLYAPASSSGPSPAIVYSHGSEQLPGPKCTIADYFVPLGYVVFVPHRRGQGRSTGISINGYAGGTQISYLQDQVADVTAAWSYVRGLAGPHGSTLVDPKRMAIAGHSYGGIMTLLTNATALGQAAAIDLCGDSESWGSTDNETALLAAVDAAKSPIFFAQPLNDVHTDPTIVYSHQAGTDGQMFQAAIYPPVPNAASPEDAHVRFVGDAAEVALWGPGAVDFLHRYGM
ncbi:MAG TPA: prolyl oligopeptidase family serine peptidase [Polyangiaceae bacterium]|nr:prolyl oligopeptidase family serine peptidase [Polyangiaceae bacterium]